MQKSSSAYSKPPLGKILSGIGKILLNELKEHLNYLDIERNYYALILIEEGKGKITQQNLATLLNTDKVSVVRVVDYLSNNGYIKRVNDKNDRRKHSLTLTKKAIKELPLIKKAIHEITNKALNGLPDNKIKELFNTLNHIKNNLNLK